ncbi:MAG: UDP-3-O-(3-hydroxymyristoyl)glucosamine N-acyltransferase, partial [Gammaproteobacteria bacterium]|nr:UDP-3-O-(3-hydroxymyristoyl)glucosamine N-acyltransferase [Gammaproteobacteria bacterium]
DGSHLSSQVYLGADCQIGNNCRLLPGVVVGSDGFGFAKDEQGHWQKMVHFGNVIIGDEVEIGANVCIDRGTFGSTRIDNGVKIDNQVHIAHNVHVGAHTLICACVGIAGSTIIGERCIIAGAAGIADKLRIADGVVIGPGTFVVQDITEAGHYTGIFPAQKHTLWQRNYSKIKNSEVQVKSKKPLHLGRCRPDDLPKYKA